MSNYQKEREQFIVRAQHEGLSLDVCYKLLRYASTLQRLAVAQCNGDWPYNGDRDRPSVIPSLCHVCNGTGAFKIVAELDAMPIFDDCEACHGTGKTWTRDIKADARHNVRYATCPQCLISGVSKLSMSISSELKQRCGNGQPTRICPDCRTRELVTVSLAGITRTDTAQTTPYSKHASLIRPVFGGDPRGAVLRLDTPGFPCDVSGRGGADGLYVPARNS